MKALKVIRDTDEALVTGRSATIDQMTGEGFIRVFESAIKKDPAYPANYVFIGYIYRFQHNYAEALNWLFKGVSVDARFRERDNINEGYKEIRNIRRVDKGPHNEEINKRIDRFIAQFKRRYPDQIFNFVFWMMLKFFDGLSLISEKLSRLLNLGRSALFYRIIPERHRKILFLTGLQNWIIFLL